MIIQLFVRGFINRAPAVGIAVVGEAHEAAEALQ